MRPAAERVRILDGARAQTIENVGAAWTYDLRPTAGFRADAPSRPIPRRVAFARRRVEAFDHRR